MIKPGLCFIKKSDIGLLPRQILNYTLACKKVTTVQIGLKYIPTFTDQTHILLTNCIPARLSRIEKVISDILHEGDTVDLLNIDKTIT